MGALMILFADPGNEFRILLKYLLDIAGRCNYQQVGLVYRLNTAMRLDINIVGATDGLPIRRGNCDVKKWRGGAISHTLPESSGLFRMSMGPKIVVAMEL